MSGASAFGSASCGTFSSSTMMVMMTAITPSLKASSLPLVMRPPLVYSDRGLKIGGQFPREPGRRYFLASAGVLAGPERREIAGAFAFGPGAQGGEGGVARGLALQRRAMHRARGGFRAKQISRSDLHARRAERHGRRDAPCIGDAARGDDRELHRAHDLRQQRKRAELGAQIIRKEHAAMPARPQALRDDGIHPVRLEPERFFDGGR